MCDALFLACMYAYVVYLVGFNEVYTITYKNSCLPFGHITRYNKGKKKENEKKERTFVSFCDNCCLSVCLSVCLMLYVIY